MAKSKVLRKLVVGERTFRYALAHQHQIDASSGRTVYSTCTELLAIGLDQRPRCELTIAFRGGPGGLVPDGGMGSHAGMVRLLAIEDGYLNLNEPGVVRAFLDAAMARGWIPEGAPLTLDGWDLLEDVVRARHAAKP